MLVEIMLLCRHICNLPACLGMPLNLCHEIANPHMNSCPTLKNNARARTGSFLVFFCSEKLSKLHAMLTLCL